MQTSQTFCGGMLRAVPSARNLPMRGPRLMSTARQVPPAMACTTPEA
jgi:hypothetical protein